MPLKSGRMTRQELAFVEVMSATGDATYSARKAGYKAAQQSGHQNMLSPVIQNAIREKEHATLVTELLPAATRKLSAALTEKGVPWGAALKAVEIVMKRAYGEEAGGIGKAPSEMSPGELNEALDKLRRELSDRATPIIDAEPADVRPPDEAPLDGVFE